jgi:hypothetical protein
MSLECIVSNTIWHAQQPLSFGPISLTSRMTVVRLRDGSLWIHSPISPTPQLIEELNAIGPVRYVIAPNKSHHLFFLPFVAAVESAEGFVPIGIEVKRPDLTDFLKIPREAPWSDDLQGFYIEGLPVLNETVWFHETTGTLIVTDLLFCFSRMNRGLTSLVAKMLGVHGTIGMSRTMKFATKDKQALAQSVSPLLSLPIRRVITSHDQIVDEQPLAKLEQAFAWLL